MVPNDKISPSTLLSQSETFHAGIAQAKAYRNLKREIAIYLTPFNLTMMEWFSIGYIRSFGSQGVRINKVAIELDTSLPYMSKIVKSLVAKGYIERMEDTSDIRAKKLRLLPKAEKSYAEIESKLRDKMREFLYSRISREQLGVYVSVIYALSRQTDKQRPQSKNKI